MINATRGVAGWGMGTWGQGTALSSVCPTGHSSDHTLVGELWLLLLMSKTLPGMEGGWNKVLHVGWGTPGCPHPLLPVLSSPEPVCGKLQPLLLVHCTEQDRAKPMEWDDRMWLL